MVRSSQWYQGEPLYRAGSSHLKTMTVLMVMIDGVDDDDGDGGDDGNDQFCFQNR